MTDLSWDPFDTDIDTDPYEIWRRLRDEAPLYRNDTYDFWALSRFADVEAAHRDPVTYCSSHATVLEMMSPEPIATGQMIFVDPPEHTRLRSLASRAFTPRRVKELEDRIRELCADMLDPQRESGSFDYVQDFGALLPANVIASFLGVPSEDREEVRHHIDLVFHIEPGVGMINDVSLNAMIWLNEYLSRQLDARRREPIDDMMTDLAHAEITDDDGAVRHLTHEEAADFVNLLISAGTETVARMLGWAAVVLAANPTARAEMVADPALIPNAIEELLRYEAPSPVQGRWTTRDAELHGEVVPAGSKVLLLTGAAGRDERKFPDADRFDIRRPIDHHLSFGYGIHFCLGAALARLEGRVALEETLARFPEWEVDHDRTVRLHTSTVRGYAKVPISVSR
jgi:cytochrome P450